MGHPADLEAAADRLGRAMHRVALIGVAPYRSLVARRGVVLCAALAPVLVLLAARPATAADGAFRCAGVPAAVSVLPSGPAAAKPVAPATTGTRRAVVLFARFPGEGAGQEVAPAWASGLLDRDRPGSLSHFYATMSFGALRVTGQVAPRWYESEETAAAYLADSDVSPGQYGAFSRQILRRADDDLDFATFDNDGPDGIPDSGDDDGVVDMVFLVTASTPRRFLRGAATGIAGLGFEGPFVTGDSGAAGGPIRIDPLRGTVQRVGTFAQTAGAMCHEYGHVLGLPDLYDTDFLLQTEAPPEDDSAGIGAWGLMGWGASGWSGDDGPVSLSAWCRVQLGWTEVVEVTEEQQEVRLDEVGKGGRIVQVPLTALEYFLLEHRRRTGSFYDRSIPAEGLLIWHVRWRPPEMGQPGRQIVDLECADGRWADAGYPLGQRPDPVHGGDNLDFWAHDAAYAQAYAGNLGDATDPFDGVRWTAFTPETNPPALSEEGGVSARIEGIRMEGEVMRVEVHTRPLLVRVQEVKLEDADGDGIAAAGEEVRVAFRLANEGGVPARDLQVELATADSLVEIVRAETGLGDLAVGEVSALLRRESYPVLRVAPGFAGTYAATAWLKVRAQGAVIAQEPVAVPAVSPRQEVRSLAVVDSAGNGDGVAQVGEFIRLRLELAAEMPALLRIASMSLRPLDPEVAPTSSARVVLDLEGDRAFTRESPEFLVGTAAARLASLRFELQVQGPYATWLDTLSVPLAPGPDRTPPRVSGLQVRYETDGLQLYLSSVGVREAGPVRQARARVYNAEGALLADVPLVPQKGYYEGSWQPAGPGAYQMEAVVEDVAGNVGHGERQELTVPEPSSAGDAPGMTPLELTSDPQRPWVNLVAYAPADPRTVWALTQHALWRSDDAGGTWARTGLMLGTAVAEVAGDAVDPRMVYVMLSDGELAARNTILKSTDAGASWLPVRAPGSDAITALAVDPLRGGRLYVATVGEVLVSEDGGATWQGGGPADCQFLRAHPTAPDRVYAGVLASGVSRYWSLARLWRSADRGRTWTSTEFEPPLDDVAPDPHEPEGLYATRGNVLYYSPDEGRNLTRIGRLPSLSDQDRWLIQAHAERRGLVIAWQEQTSGVAGTWRTEDRGSTWVQVLKGGTRTWSNTAYVHPGDARSLYVVAYGAMPLPGLQHTADGGQHWKQVDLPEAQPSAGTVVFDPQHRLCVGAIRTTPGQMAVPGLFRSADGGRTWEWRAETTFWPVPSLGELASIDGVSFDPFDPDQQMAAWGSVEMRWEGSYGRYVGDFLRSTDGGRTWATIGSGHMPSGGPFHPVLAADPRRSGRHYIAGLLLGLRVSEDGGATWEARNRGLPADIGGGYVSLTALAQDPEASGHLCAAVEEQVWHTTDAGLTWERIGVVAAGESVWQLAYHPADSGALYAVTSQGVHLSADGGSTWARLATVDPIVASVRLRFDPHDPRRLYLVNGRDLQESPDAGRTWRSLAAALPGCPWFNDVAADPLTPEWIYVATPFGVYRLPRSGSVTAVGGEPPVPTTTLLAPAYPNPFNGAAVIRFSLSRRGLVHLAVYNVLGQQVALLAAGELEAGVHEVRWDGRDAGGAAVASGVYVCRLRVGEREMTRKLLVLR